MKWSLRMSEMKPQAEKINLSLGEYNVYFIVYG